MQLLISSHPRVPAWVWMSVFRHLFLLNKDSIATLPQAVLSKGEFDSVYQAAFFQCEQEHPSLLQHFIVQKALFVISVSFYFCRVWASPTSRVQAWTVAEDASATQRKAVEWVSVSCLPDLGSYTSTSWYMDLASLMNGKAHESEDCMCF